MAKEPKDKIPVGMRPAESPDLPAFDDEKMYNVQLWKSITYLNRRFVPKNVHQMKGSVARQYEASIHSASLAEVGSDGAPQT